MKNIYVCPKCKDWRTDPHDCEEPLSDHAVLSEVGELLPCPFCGSSDLESAKYIISYYIQCNDCQAVSPKCGTLEDLHLAWNKRANF